MKVQIKFCEELFRKNETNEKDYYWKKYKHEALCCYSKLIRVST